MNDLNYARCKACDGAFYPTWLPHQGKFEDLCHVCKPIAIRAAYMIDEEEDKFLEGYLIDKRGVSWEE